MIQSFATTCLRAKFNSISGVFLNTRRNRERRQPLNSRGRRHSFFDNWPAKVMAIAAAIILFLFQRIVTMEERFFSVPLQIETTGRYLPVAPFPQSVRVHLRGEADNIDTILENDIKRSE